MAWYNDDTRRAYVATYTDEKSMQAEVEVASLSGFIAQSTTRRGKEWTVTYHRNERELARVHLQTAVGAIATARNTLTEARDKAAHAQTVVESLFHAALTERSNPTQLEQKLLRGCGDLVTARQEVIAKCESTIAALASLQKVRSDAAREQVTLPQAEFDLDVEIAQLNVEIQQQRNQLGLERSLQHAQQTVVRVVQVWQRSVGEKWGADQQHAKVANKLAILKMTPKSDTKNKATTLEAQKAMHQAKLEKLDVQLQENEDLLLKELQIRDRFASSVFR